MFVLQNRLSSARPRLPPSKNIYLSLYYSSSLYLEGYAAQKAQRQRQRLCGGQRTRCVAAVATNDAAVAAPRRRGRHHTAELNLGAPPEQAVSRTSRTAAGFTEDESRASSSPLRGGRSCPLGLREPAAFVASLLP